MIYVVVRSAIARWNNKIINRCDAWEQDGEARMRREAHEEGWVPMESEITPMGDMIIWVE
jgi:hypothetical protein